MSSPIDSLAYALITAVSKDLTPIKQPIYHYEREPGKAGTKRVDTGETKDVRPREDHCEIYHFPQVWGSTALGFGGLGGQAITTAYTTVIFGPQGDACIYFAGRLAYHLEHPNIELRRDIAECRVAEVAKRGRYENR